MELLKSPDLSPRIRILVAIEKGYRKFNEIARATGLALSTVSKYLSVLVSSGMVTRIGREYVLAEAGEKLLRELVEQITETMNEARDGQ